MNLPLRARCPYLVKAADELLAVFVAGNLQNTLNATAWHWQKRRRWAAEWKERTRMALLEHHQRYGVPRDVTTRTPKRLVFTLCVPRAWDDDALPGGVKAVRDALVPYVIHSDGPDSGHEFVYDQRIDRTRRGVEVRVRLRAPQAASEASEGSLDDARKELHPRDPR